MKRAALISVSAALFISLLSVGCSQEQQPTDALTIGDPFPDLLLTDFSGRQSRLSEYRGKLLVVNLWATWCEPCRREMPNLQQLSDSLDGDRFAVIGIAGDDDVHVVREYLRDKQIKFAKYIDAGHQQASERLGVALYPYTFLVSPQGVLLDRVPGPREWHNEAVMDLLESAYHGDY